VISQTTVAAAHADEWQFEVTPYLWAAGIDGELTIGGQEVEVDASFSDIADTLDVGGSLLAEASNGRWVNWMQLDHLSTDTGDIDAGPVRADLESKTTMLAVGTGWRFPGPGARSTVDVLVGVRQFSIDDTLDLRGGSHIDNHMDLYDAIVALRPRLQLGTHWTFSPTLSIGGGDSDLVWEMSPQFEYRYGERYELRVGYRNLAYDVDQGGSKIDISFRGPVLGLGFRF
jgi:hypothetical protein